MGGQGSPRRPRVTVGTQRGFGVVGLLCIVVAIGLVVLMSRFISDARQDNQKQSNTFGNAFNGDETPDDPSDDDYVPDAPDSGSVDRPIRRVNSRVDTLFVVLEATLPDSYTGTCYAIVTLPDGSEKQRYTEEIENTKTCQITVPLRKLQSGRTWVYTMNYHTIDGKVTAP